MSTTLSGYKQKLDKEIYHVIKNSDIGKEFLPSSKSITYSAFLKQTLLKSLLIRQGIPYSLFNSINLLSPLTQQDWAAILNISTKSLNRYRVLSKHFKPIQSEKIIEISEVLELGLEVFGSLEKFDHWLKTPNFALGKFIPLDLLKDSYGKDLVMGELTRINYGILA
jgi:putative toxin-antitoxin system antitoxin component (TIGR02293 family)